jgi:hypothetical protein
MTKQQLKDYGESIGIKLNLKHKKDDLIDQLNKASQTNADNTIKANVKVEITNATTEKVFKAVGNTISSGKQAVTTGTKAATSFAQKIIVPVIILAIIGGIGAYMYDKSQIKECEQDWLNYINESKVNLNNPGFDFKKLNTTREMYADKLYRNIKYKDSVSCNSIF